LLLISGGQRQLGKVDQSDFARVNGIPLFAEWSSNSLCTHRTLSTWFEEESATAATPWSGELIAHPHLMSVGPRSTYFDPKED
jgi:hypothetical protein